jgi:hypothetical protein
MAAVARSVEIAGEGGRTPIDAAKLWPVGAFRSNPRPREPFARRFANSTGALA